MNSTQLNFEINKMLKSDYYYPTLSTVKSIKTSHTQFPYPNFFRGNVNNKEVVVYDRPAGYYKPKASNPIPYNFKNKLSDLCFESPCSITFPCRSIFKNQNMISDPKIAYRINISP